MRHTALLGTVVAAALFAFYLPSSVGGVISRPLSVVSIAGTCALLTAMIAASGRLPPALNIAASLAVAGLLALFTITSPFSDYAPGVVLLYGAVALLFLVDLRGVRSRQVGRVFQGITVLSLVLGYALALNVPFADRLMLTWFAAFYPELLSNMVTVFNKPVLTFATHSMAGFMIYLFFYMQLTAWRAQGGLWRLAAAAGYLGLLVLLKSTTGLAFTVVAGLQVAVLVEQALPRQRAILFVALLLAGYAALTFSGLDIPILLARAEEAIVGDRVRGLFSRYAADGLLASNMKYLSDSPLSPIGVGATDTLYLGDSGLVVNILRGSVPLLIAVYGGLWLFLRTNLEDQRAAAWLWICIVLFEIGFTPLQYFRFVAFLPFLVVYLNSCGGPVSTRAAAPPGPVRLGAHPASR